MINIQAAKTNALEDFQKALISLENFHDSLLQPESKSFPLAIGQLDFMVKYYIEHAPNRLKLYLTELLTHVAWKQFFDAIDLYNTHHLDYFDIIKPYTFDNVEQKLYHSGFNTLIEFNADNIDNFIAEISQINHSKINKNLKLFLGHCGASSRPEIFKKSLLINNFGNNFTGVNHKISELIINLAYALSIAKKDPNPKVQGETYTKLSQKFDIGHDVEIYSGLYINLKSNGKANISFSEENLSILNNSLN